MDTLHVSISYTCPKYCASHFTVFFILYIPRRSSTDRLLALCMSSKFERIEPLHARNCYYGIVFLRDEGINSLHVGLAPRATHDNAPQTNEVKVLEAVSGAFCVKIATVDRQCQSMEENNKQPFVAKPIQRLVDQICVEWRSSFHTYARSAPKSGQRFNQCLSYSASDLTCGLEPCPLSIIASAPLAVHA